MRKHIIIITIIIMYIEIHITSRQMAHYATYTHVLVDITMFTLLSIHTLTC